MRRLSQEKKKKGWVEKRIRDRGKGALDRFNRAKECKEKGTHTENNDGGISEKNLNKSKTSTETPSNLPTPNNKRPLVGRPPSKQNRQKGIPRGLV